MITNLNYYEFMKYNKDNCAKKRRKQRKKQIYNR